MSNDESEDNLDPTGEMPQAGGDTTGRDRLQELIGDDYRLQWIIGHGGMSTVWLADDTVNQREVAIKVLRPEFSDNREFLDRFRNEAIAAESIDSENVVRTYDFREIPDPAGHTFCFIAMEFVRGESLADLLAREGTLHEALALDVLEQAAHGLSVIHRMDLVHRDIKPGNLMVTQTGQVKITDFGIAKAAAAVPLTRTGMVVGTAQYVSPEQAQGHTVTSASDVYSLGVVGYEMLSGTRPFTGDSSVSVVIAHINQAPAALPTSVTAQARELVGISLRKDPTTRFADGNELALAVAAVRNGNRPPQPKSAAMTQRAAEPAPTASTVALGNVAQPTQVTTAAAATTGGSAAPAAIPARQSTKKRSGPGGFGTGLAIAVGLAAAAAGGIYLASSGAFSGEEQPTPSPSPDIVTETITPTEEEPQQPTSPGWQPEDPTRPGAPTRQPTSPTGPQEPTGTQDVPPPGLTTDVPGPPTGQPGPGNGGGGGSPGNGGGGTGPTGGGGGGNTGGGNTGGGNTGGGNTGGGDTGGGGNTGGGDTGGGAGATPPAQSAPEASGPTGGPTLPGATPEAGGGQTDSTEGGAP